MAAGRGRFRTVCLEALLNLFEFTGCHHGEAVFEFIEMLLTFDFAFVVSMGDTKVLTARAIHKKMRFFFTDVAPFRFFLFRHFFPITLYDLKTSFFLYKMISYHSKTVFSLVGDWGALTPSRDRVLHVLEKMRLELDFCILLGDNFYPNGVKSVDDPRWEKEVLESFPTTLRLYAILGNHDYHVDPSAQIQFSFLPFQHTWKMPYYYYRESFPHLDIFFLDTAILAPWFTDRVMQESGVGEHRRRAFTRHAQSLRDGHIKWIETELAKSNARWKMVCGHYPLASNGPHESSRELSDVLLPLMKTYGVQVYAGGHDHNAQVIQHESMYCIVSGSVSFSNPTSIRHPGTLYFSSCPGQFVCQTTKERLQIQYVNQDQQVAWEFSIV